MLPAELLEIVPGAVATPRVVNRPPDTASAHAGGPRKDEVGEPSSFEDSTPRVVIRPPGTASAHAGGIVLGDTIEAGFVEGAVDEGLAVEVVELTSPPNFCIFLFCLFCFFLLDLEVFDVLLSF